MKTNITESKSLLSKGLVVSAYFSRKKGYILLDNDKVYALYSETEDEECRVREFIDQLYVGTYVFVYQAQGHILKIFDLLNKQVLDCESEADCPDEVSEVCGRLKLKAKDCLFASYEVFVFGIISQGDVLYYTYLLNKTQEKTRRNIMRLQGGDEVVCRISDKGVLLDIRKV